MNELGEIIKKNKSFFDNDEPQDGHFERFQQKLQKSKKVSFKINTNKILRIASIVILLIISSIWVFEKVFPTAKNQKISLGEVSIEYREVESYYTNLYQLKLEELNQSINIDPELEKEILLNEFNDLDSLYQSLQKELGYNKGDERIINAMINYYKTKVEVLNRIMCQLNKINEEKKTIDTQNVKKAI